MKTIKSPRLSVLTRIVEHERRPRLVIGVTAAFRLGAEKHLVPDIEMWPQAIAALEAENGILDEATPKVRAELLVNGSCYPPGGTPQSVSFVRVKVGSVDKRLAVIGDRRWKLGVPTEPQPFDKMPVDWTRAFGGEGFDRNPKGRGFAPVETDGGKVHALPNVEDPKKLIESPSDTPEPAGFGGLDITLPQRKAKFGTYDKDWLETRAYGFAADMDPTLFNLAQPDQWLDGWFRGDETYLIENMHPSRARIEGQLPPLAVRVFVTRKEPDGQEVFKEVATRIDTLRLFPEHLLGVLIYRGVVDVHEDDADDVRELMLACEDRSAPRATDHYQRALVARRDPEQAGLLALSDRDIVPQRELGWHTPKTSDIGEHIPRPEFVVEKNLKRFQALELEQAKERLVAAGLDPKDFKLDEPPAAPSDIDYEDPDAVTKLVEEQKAQREQHEKELEKERKAAEAGVRAALAEQGLDYDAERKKALKENSGPPKLEARRQMEQLKSLLELARKHDQPNLEMERIAADPAYYQELVDGETRLREAYVMAAHHQEAVDPLPHDASAPFRAEIEVAHHNQIGLEARDFSGIDLTGMALAGMDFAGGFLESANLTGTDLTGANLQRAVLAHGKLAGTRLTDARLSGANLGRTEIVDANFDGAQLDKTILEKARIANSSFQRVKLDMTSLLDTTFGENVDFTGATGVQMVFYKLDLRTVKLRGARFNKCVFMECDLRGADLTGINLSTTAIVTCRADGARFCEATLRGTQFVVGTTLVDADFSRAQLGSATLRGLDLRRAKLGGAVLDCADLSKCDLSGADLGGVHAHKAMFMGTMLAGANMARADLLSALLTRAKLHGANLSGANLFQADMAKVQVDGATNLDRANLERARMHPKYQPPKPMDEKATDGS
jgi:uncharacterized protein YjbI with pentapeptide repeats